MNVQYFSLMNMHEIFLKFLKIFLNFHQIFYFQVKWQFWVILDGVSLFQRCSLEINLFVVGEFRKVPRVFIMILNFIIFIGNMRKL